MNIARLTSTSLTRLVLVLSFLLALPSAAGTLQSALAATTGGVAGGSTPSAEASLPGALPAAEEGTSNTVAEPLTTTAVASSAETTAAPAAPAAAEDESSAAPASEPDADAAVWPEAETAFSSVGPTLAAAAAAQQAETPPEGQPHLLIPSGSVWKYLDNGTDQGTAWRETSFADGTWLSGSAQLGYGDGDEKTVIGYGPDSTNKHITTYFRRSFNVADASVYKSLKLRLLRDDGAVVYLNGREVFRSNMPAGAVNYKTAAAAGVADANEKTFYEKKIDPSLLLSGANVVAVEVHQDGGTSSDLSFDLEFVGSTVVPLVPTGAVWKYLDNGSNQGTAWREPSFADAAWASGPAQLGYGDGDEQTVVSYGPDPTKKYITTYFRHAFNVIDPAIYKGLLLRLLKDDGAVVYLNGKEVFRSGIAGGGAVTNTTPASTARYETTFGEKPVDPNLLVKGTNVLAVEVHQDGGTSSDMSFDLELLPTNPAAFVPMGSVWKYLDNGTDQGTAWRETSFADGAWPSGLGQLGYGDGDEKTVLSYGPDPNNKHITTYFRRSFSVADPAAYKSLTLRLLRDDGAVVYLNGREVFRSNMPAGAVGYQTTASSNTGHESLFHKAAVDPGLLLQGTNVVAVEVHQDYAASSDLSFDLELVGSKETLSDSDGIWKYLDNGTDQGTAWRELSFNDAAWASGPAQLGYGDGDERTVVSYGPDPNNKYVTTYFRRLFNVADASAYKALKLRLLRDDGAVVYLNGREVFRSNMPVGPVGYQTVSLESADFGEESAFYETTIDASLVANGTNVLAVEVHQSSPTSSSDASFDLELLAGNKAPTVSLTSPANGQSFGAPVNVTVSANAADDDGTVSKVEFYANSKLIGTATTSPYTVTWGNVAAGSYTLTAVATDNAGATAVTDSVSMKVEPAAANPNAPAPPPPGSCKVADVVALDQAFYYNRLGAFNPSGMIYALRRDVVPVDSSKGHVEGNVQLRPDKRPRPLVLRMNVGDCLTIKFQNLLSPRPADDNQPATRSAGVHVMGLQLVNNILDDGSHVGQNASSLVEPGGTATYTYYAEREGNHLLYSAAATTGGEGDGGSLAMGLFGSVNVEPKGAEYYRSQVTAQELAYATTGRTPANQPIINYDATYPAGHPRAGQPVLKIVGADGEIVHSDLNAVITGPNKGRFPAGTYRPNDRVPDRDQPFREFTVVYHDEIKAVQAFPQFFEDPVLSHTLHSVRDGFAINYGTGGIGAEILANRLGVGPMANCTECKYEEFFLSAWAVGDPAQIVDVPASTQLDASGQKIPGAPRATKVLYPDDPSNVHHSYLNDHVKMRVVHAGPKEHHVHHLHAHQWLRTPDSNDSSYLDSQAVGPGYSFTTEIAHGGSGNLNKTVGDSIFHCHFYPHFAQGMWELWRTHDVFEAGTELDAGGRPTASARRLPDGEIAGGTPIPAIVPVPTIAMPPMPTEAFQGYPFYIPGVAGHRPPKPPLDTVDDGGLPRHVVTGGTFVEHHTRLDFNKELLTAAASQVSEGGTAEELAAMQFHGARTHASYTPAGLAALFITNGLPRKDATATGARKYGAQPGAPFADPCVDAQGNPVGARRVYKAANVQLDLTLNKAGWHFPQSRISVLWDDVRPTLDGQRAPEPLFFRAHSLDCIEFFHTNLVPHVYAQDDFQVKTPTDVMGQHIHLVKFDVTSSDGSGNGWNYEDGTFSPGEVQERIRAIRKQNGCAGVDRGDARDGTFTCPVAKEHPTLGLSGKDEDGNGVDDWLGAQTTVQRWYAESPSLRTVFTHDHFGPSTHQQAGFYAGLVIEPAGTKWKHNETGLDLNTRADGGPTSWQAAIIDPLRNEGYREFLLEFSDYQLAYRKDATAVNPPARKEVALSAGNWLVEPAPQCPGGVPRPCPEAVSADDVGTMSVNYRNEPVALRVRNPQTNGQADGEAGDLSHVFRSNVTRADAAFNAQPTFYPALTSDLSGGDPFTPMLRAYEHDRVQIQVLVGGFEEGHNFGVHGIKWLFEPDEKNSGYRNNQMMGISEHFEFVVPKLAKNSLTTDYLYQPGAATDDAWNGQWGLMRAYSQARQDLFTMPNNPSGFGPAVSNPGDFNGVCPKGVVPKTFEVTAVAAGDALPGGTLVYNPRADMGGKLHDPTAIIFVRNSDLDPLTGKLKTDTPEPLILRANAGDCIEVTLTNRLPGLPPDLDGYNTLPMIVEKFNNNNVAPSAEVGLHPQLLHYNVNRSNGVNVGFNAVQTARPGSKVTYQWYAGDLSIDSVTGVGTATPVEFGAINLTSSDPIKHGSKGAVGALIIEPQGSVWIEDANSRAQATVTKADGTSFREFVLLFQNDLNLRYGARADGQGRPAAVPNTAEAEDAEDSGQKGFNYRTEPLWKRVGFEPNTPLEQTRGYDFAGALSNGQVGGDPVTPVFTAAAGQPVRMRVLMPAGHARNNVFHLHGHIWEEEPYVNDSKALGSNALSEWKGAQYGVGPGSHFDLLLKNGAGGYFRVAGDYLYRTHASFQFDGGLWGIFRVQ